MRSSRFIATLVALVFAAIVPMAAAQATTTSTTVSAKARAEHDVRRLDAGEIRQTGRFYVKGVAVTWKNKVVKLQKQKCKTCVWRTFKKDRTSSTGRFRMTFDGPRGSCWRIFIPRSTKYQPFTARVGCIVAG